MAGKGSFRSGENDAKGFAKGVDTLGKSLEKLSKDGKLTSDSIMQISSAVGKANPLLGALGTAIGIAVAQGEKLKALELAEAMDGFATSTNQVSIGWDRFTSAMTAGAGETGVLKEKVEALANAQINLRMIDARVNAEIERQTELMKTKGIAEDVATANVERFVAKERERYAFQTTVRVGLEKEISLMRARNKEVEKAPAAQSRFDQAMHISEIRQEHRNDLLEEELQLKNDILAVDARVADSEWNTMLDSANQRQAAQNAALEQQNALWGDFAQGVAITAATNALNAYYDALDRTVSLNAIFAGGFDRAMRNAAASTVRSVGQIAAVKAIEALATGWMYLGTPGMQGFAPFQFKSAALFSAIAVGAGPGAGLLSVAPGGGGGSGRGGSGRDSSNTGSGRSGPVIHVTVIGTLDTEARKNLGAQLAQEWAEAG